MALKSRSSRASSVCASSAGFRSMDSRTADRSSGSRLESVSTSGPEMPKWVNSISPSSEYSFFSFFPPLTQAVSVTFFSESPIRFAGQLSLVSMGTSAGSAFFTPWPACAARR